jgi:leucine dehydrogenase
MAISFTDLPSEMLSGMTSFDDHEQVRRFVLDGGIVAFIAVHNTNLGPALGGGRMRAYTSEAEALDDVLRLSRGMTYKNAVAGLPLGGGKSVILADPRQFKSEELMQSMGEAVESLEGSYVIAEDSGTTEEDMVEISKNTDHVTGLPPEMLVGSDYGELGGNPSPLTALGVYKGMQAAVDFRYKGERTLGDMTVAVQGVGAVGFELCKLLDQDGVRLIIADIDEDNIKRAKQNLKNIEIVGPEEIYAQKADIFAPCALGGVLNDITIDQLKVDIIAGASNNQLLDTHHDKLLESRNILYVPDYVVNAGGVICVGYEYFRNSGYNPQELDIQRGSMVAHVETIGDTVREILEKAEKRGQPTGETADQVAEERFVEGAALNDNDEADDDDDFGTATSLVH